MMSADWINKRYMSFDISQSRTAWVVMLGKTVLGMGDIQSNGSKIGITQRMFPHVLLDFKDKINMAIENATSEYGKTDVFLVEDLNIKFNTSAKTLFHYHAATKIAIAEQGYDIGCEMINNQTVKSFMGVKTRKSLFSDSSITFNRCSSVSIFILFLTNSFLFSIFSKSKTTRFSIEG